MLRTNSPAGALCGLGLILLCTLPAQTPPPGVDTIYSGAGGDRFGFRIASGDLNHDGIDDLVVGAPHETGGNRVYVYFGPIELPMHEVPHNGADVVIQGPLNSETGWSITTGNVVAGAEDDLILGAPSQVAGKGAVHVFAGPIAPGTYSTAMATLTVEGHRGLGHAGWAVAAGDFDGDGIDELCIGAATVGLPEVGECYVMDVENAAGPVISTTEATSTLLGVGVTGSAMCNGGDFNGDGFEDLIVGSYGNFWVSGHGWGGTAHIVYGRAAFDAVLDLANAVGSGVANLNGEFEGHNVGYDLAPAGDVNHDGYDDLLIGAPTFLVSSEPGGVDDTGYAYLVLGSRDIGRPQLLGDYPIGWIADLIFAGTTIGERVGLSVAGAGYCGPTWSRVKSNGGGTPGRGDVLLIGTGIDTVHSHAYWIDRETQQSSVGQPVPLKRRRLLVELGNGANRIGSFTITGPAGSALGRWVHGPADLDGDGLSDLLLGAPYQLDYSDPAGDGRVHVHRGQ